MLSDVDYKILSFTREDAVDVQIKVNLTNAYNSSENFLVLSKDNIDTVKEILLFGWINVQRYTLTEFNFFALNNNMCLTVLDKQSNVLNTLGICGLANNRIFGIEFGLNFN